MATKLTKQFVVVYDENKSIISKSENNKETFVGIDKQGVEFDSKEELEQFIIENNLTKGDLI